MFAEPVPLESHDQVINTRHSQSSHANAPLLIYGQLIT